MTQKLFRAMGISEAGVYKSIQWVEMTHHLSLDILEITVLGYDFEAIEKPDSSFANVANDQLGNSKGIEFNLKSKIIYEIVIV